MAYMSQPRKTELAPGIRAVLKKYNLKGTLKVRHNACLVLTLRSGPIDFGPDHRVNMYNLGQNDNSIAAKALYELSDAMNVGNHDNSMPQCDYFDVGWYTDIRIGEPNKPYIKQING
jgi:hypothetical protein